MQNRATRSNLWVRKQQVLGSNPSVGLHFPERVRVGDVAIRSASATVDSHSLQRPLTSVDRISGSGADASPTVNAAAAVSEE